MNPLLLALDAPLARSPFPEREDKAPSLPDEWARAWMERVRGRLARSSHRERGLLERRQVRESAALSALTDEQLLQQLRRCAPQAVRALDRATLHQALLLVAEAAHRSLGMRPYATQMLGAAVLLRGQLAEMATGEGKTLTAALAAAVAAVAGVPVHVVTVNDYLARRDAEKGEPLFTYLGLSVGAVVHGIDPDTKRRAYASDITYCTNKELVFDYLRDRVAAGSRASQAQVQARSLAGGHATVMMLRGLHLAIVDEADSILIDEARTPLILAEKAGAEPDSEAFGQALAVAAGLLRGAHFEIDIARRALHLTDTGRAQLAATLGRQPGPWRAAHAREHLVAQALRAHHLFLRDRQYLVDGDGKIQIIDEYTGRVLPGRTWEQGLHQMIETKEGLELSEKTQTLARITYQRFFPRYLRLAGMTGTAREVGRELAAVYRLRTVPVPTHRPNARLRQPDLLLADEAAKWRTVATEVARWQALGRPVLVGTRSVEASERLSGLLDRAAVPHQVLNARHDAQESAIVADAGRAGVVTVATNMAGRGTDISLGPGVAEQGGLCVILTEYHESPRIDRQLFGRCARQGDPGTCLAIVALDDALFKEHGGPEMRWLGRLGAMPAAIGRFWMAWCRRRAQARAERMHARTRRDTLRRDRDLDKLMAFSGDRL